MLRTRDTMGLELEVPELANAISTTSPGLPLITEQKSVMTSFFAQSVAPADRSAMTPPKKDGYCFKPEKREGQRSAG